MVFPAVHRIVRDREEAEDIMQESMIKGFGRLHELKEPQGYVAWQKQIAIRAALNYLRSKNKNLVFVEEQNPNTEEEVENDFPFSAEQVMKHIDELPDGFRLVIQLYLIEGLTHEEVGHALNITASTSRSQYTRALAKLRSEVNKEYEKSI